MSQMVVIGEDALCCALGERLVKDVLGWTLALSSINARGVTRLQAALPRYVGLASVFPVLCVADTDGQCPVEWLARWQPKPLPDRFMLRLAVTEAESWLLADAASFAGFFGVPKARVPPEPDVIADPSRQILTLARKSSKRVIRQEVVSSVDPSKPGAGYNLHLCGFVARGWNARRAAEQSPSLARAVQRLMEFAA